MPTTIIPELPNTPDAIALINELESVLAPLYPDESRHGFSVDMLIAQNVAFFVTRHDETPAGCGGIKLFGSEYGEVKRMYVRPQFRGLGLAKQMLEQLAAYAQQNGVTILRLETGMHQTEAMKLYEGWGFTRIGPFGEYTDDPMSRYYEKHL